MKEIILYSFFAALSVFAVQQVQAQAGDVQFGAKAGISLYDTKFSISSGGFNVNLESDKRLGFAVGGYAIVPFHELFAFQPELMFIQKGGKFSDEDLFDDSEAELIFNFLDIPLLLRFNIPVDAPVSPYLTAGPVAGIFLSGTSKFNGESESIDEGTNTLNLGLSLGGGVSFNQFHFDIRYEIGLSSVLDDEEEDDDDFFEPVDSSVTTSGLMFTIGYTF